MLKRDATMLRTVARLAKGVRPANVDRKTAILAARLTGEWSKRRILQEYLAMTRRAISQGAALVIWPESSTPFRFEDNAAGADEIRAIAGNYAARGRDAWSATTPSWARMTTPMKGERTRQ